MRKAFSILVLLGIFLSYAVVGLADPWPGYVGTGSSSFTRGIALLYAAYNASGAGIMY